jgi:anti-sigma regulatory factor (Ser/Thr protein kinase)
MKFEGREQNEVYEEEFSWDNSLENIDVAVSITEDKLKELGWPEDQRGAFADAVREAMMNAIVHGNLNINKSDGENDFTERIRAAQEIGENKMKQVRVFFRFTKDEATAQIKDEGTFVPDKIVDMTAEGQLLKGSARGLPLIAMKVDNLAFSPGEVILHKQRKDNEDAIG